MLLEYSVALCLDVLALAGRCSSRAASTSIHACNPPDLFFLIGGFFKLFGKKFVFDHHDINPELYEAKFGRRDFFWKADGACSSAGPSAPPTCRSPPTSPTAASRSSAAAWIRERVFVVRSGPSLERLKIVPARSSR